MSAIGLVIKGGRLPDGTTADVCIDGETIFITPTPTSTNTPTPTNTPTNTQTPTPTSVRQSLFLVTSCCDNQTYLMNLPWYYQPTFEMGGGGLTTVVVIATDGYCYNVTEHAKGIANKFWNGNKNQVYDNQANSGIDGCADCQLVAPCPIPTPTPTPTSTLGFTNYLVKQCCTTTQYWTLPNGEITDFSTAIPISDCEDISTSARATSLRLINLYCENDGELPLSYISYQTQPCGAKAIFIELPDLETLIYVQNNDSTLSAYVILYNGTIYRDLDCCNNPYNPEDYMNSLTNTVSETISSLNCNFSYVGTGLFDWINRIIDLSGGDPNLHFYPYRDLLTNQCMVSGDTQVISITNNYSPLGKVIKDNGICYNILNVVTSPPTIFWDSSTIYEDCSTCFSTFPTPTPTQTPTPTTTPAGSWYCVRTCSIPQYLPPLGAQAGETNDGNNPTPCQSDGDIPKISLPIGLPIGTVVKGTDGVCYETIQNTGYYTSNPVGPNIIQEGSTTYIDCNSCFKVGKHDKMKLKYNLVEIPFSNFS